MPASIDDTRPPRGRIELAQAKRARRQARNRGYRLHRLFLVHGWRHCDRVYPASWCAWVVAADGCAPWGSRGPTPEDAVRAAIETREADAERWRAHRAAR